jgi:hypothetical protein
LLEVSGFDRISRINAMNIKSTLLATALVAFIPSISLADNRSNNDEPTCQATGSGMDQRCVGDTTAGAVTDRTTESQQHRSGVATPAAAREQHPHN